MTDPSEIMDKGVEAALRLACEEGWPAVTLSGVAEWAGLELGAFHGVADKAAIGHAVEAWFDSAMLREAPVLEGTPRERLFDVLMNRFEAMEPYRDGLVSFWKWRQRQPAEMARMAGERKTTADWALVSAGLDGSQDVPAGLRGVNLAWVVAKAGRAWRKDQGPDFTRTMSTLDRELRAAEEREGWLARVMGGRRRDTQSAETPSDSPAADTADGPDEPPHAPEQS